MSRAGSHADAFETPALEATDDRLVSTIVAPVLSEPHRPGKNLLYCATFQLAWNELVRRAGGRVRVAGDPPIAAALDASAGSRDEVDEASCVARAGTVEDGVLDAVRRELEAKFGGAASASLPSTLPPGSVCLYAYLFATLAFEMPLCAAGEEPRILFKGVPVRSFGVWEEHGDRASWEARAREVVVLDHRHDADFVVEILTSQANDRLIVAMVPHGETLAATVTDVLARADARPSLLARALRRTALRRGEELVVPSMHFAITRVYRELLRLKIESPALPDHYVADARQTIAFRLDERGAVLRSEATATVLPAPVRRERKLWCTGPFLVLLTRRGAARPYFAAWIETPELLQPIRGLPGFPS